MKKILYTLFLLFVTKSMFSQTQFHMRYGSSYHDHASKVIQTQDGNYVVVGSTDGFGSNGNALIMKVNAIGTILWVKDYSGINEDEINDIIELPNKNLIMCGVTGSYGAGSDDFFVMKTDSIGNLIWARAHGSVLYEGLLKISEDGAGGFYAAGYASDTVNNGITGSVILRMDSTGNILWAKWLNDLSSATTVDMTPVASGGVILAEVVAPNNKFSLYKYNALGNLIWSNNYFPTPVFSGLFGFGVIENNSGDILVDYSLNNQNTFAQSTDNFILKLNSNGSLISNNAYGGTYSDINTTIANTSDGGLILCGYTNSAGNGADDAYLIKINPNGSVHWAKAYGTIWEEHPTNPKQTSDGGFVFTGATHATGNNYDSAKVYLVKTDSLGNSSCNDISWNPTKTNQTISIGSATPPINRTFQKTPINWALNSRYFYKMDICNPFSIESITPSMDNWNVYPNPTSDQFFIDANTTDKLKVDLFDVNGRHVFSASVMDKSNVNIATLDNGAYTLTIKTADRVINKKLVILH